MKKQNVLNLIKYHVEKNENAFRNEAVNIARYFDSIGDDQLAEYIMGLMSESNLYTPQSSDFESEFLKQIDIRGIEPLSLPSELTDDIIGIINAVNHNIGINKFLFEGLPGSGKTEAAKQVARLLNRTLFCVDFDNIFKNMRSHPPPAAFSCRFRVKTVDLRCCCACSDCGAFCLTNRTCCVIIKIV